jgi:putative tryptophan/tyrosine transport system substrate-binding protein
MKRRNIIFLLGGLAWGPGILAQVASPATRKIGLLVVGGEAERGHLEKALLEGLRSEGYVEGRNLVIERRYAEGDQSRARPFARELAALNLDAVVTTCSPSTRLMKESAPVSTPIVMAVVSDPVKQGLISSLARPGANVTGVSSQFEDAIPKMLEFFAAMLPNGARIAVLANPGNAVHPSLWELTAASSRKLKLVAARHPVERRADLEAVIAKSVQEGATALFVLPDDPFFFNSRARIVKAAAEHRLPGMYFAREFVEAGGLMSFGEDMSNGYRRAARYVGKVLTGTRPADLAVEQPTRFELVVNLNAAKAIGVKLPETLLLRADRVIE